MAFVYFLMGGVFTYIAILNADETVFNLFSMVLLLIAALDFFIGFRYIKRNSKKEK